SCRRRCGFLFQAEDGIRVFHVTGVQTCALPILPFRCILPLTKINRGEYTEYRRLGKLEYCVICEKIENDICLLVSTCYTRQSFTTTKTAEHSCAFQSNKTILF